MSELGSGDSKAHRGFREGDYVKRKGRLGQIEKIHFTMHPPSVTVKMLDNDAVVDTEFHYLEKATAADVKAADIPPTPISPVGESQNSSVVQDKADASDVLRLRPTDARLIRKQKGAKQKQTESEEEIDVISLSPSLSPVLSSSRQRATNNCTVLKKSSRDSSIGTRWRKRKRGEAFDGDNDSANRLGFGFGIGNVTAATKASGSRGSEQKKRRKMRVSLNELDGTVMDLLADGNSPGSSSLKTQRRTTVPPSLEQLKERRRKKTDGQMSSGSHKPHSEGHSTKRKKTKTRSSPLAWACGICTYHNTTLDAVTCEMCMSPRTADSMLLYPDIHDDSDVLPMADDSAAVCDDSTLVASATAMDSAETSSSSVMATLRTSIAEEKRSSAPDIGSVVGERQLSCLQYNVWFEESVAIRERMRAIGRIVEDEKVDILTIQECTPLILRLLRSAHWYRRGKWTDTAEHNPKDLPYFNVIFVRQMARVVVGSGLLSLKLQQAEVSLLPFMNSKMGRFLVQCPVSVQFAAAQFATESESESSSSAAAGSSVAAAFSLCVATTHLESPVGTWAGGRKDQFSPQRKLQLRVCLGELQKNECCVFEGDFNWLDPTKTKEKDGDMRSYLRSRDEATEVWTDAWRQLHGEDKGYTYDGRRNPMLTNYLRSRLDRVLFKGERLKCTECKMVGTEPIPEVTYHKKSKSSTVELPVLASDHFGVLTRFRF